MEHGLCSCLIATRLAFGWFMVPPGGSRMCGDRRSAAPPAHRENYRDSGPSAGFRGFEAQAQSAFAPQPSGACDGGAATVAGEQGAPPTSLEAPILVSGAVGFDEDFQVSREAGSARRRAGRAIVRFAALVGVAGFAVRGPPAHPAVPARGGELRHLLVSASTFGHRPQPSPAVWAPPRHEDALPSRPPRHARRRSPDAICRTFGRKRRRPAGYRRAVVRPRPRGRASGSCLGAGDSALEGGAGLEARHGAGGDLDLRTGLRVAAGARGALARLEGAEARDRHLLALGDGAGDGVEHGLQCTLGVGSAEPSGLGHGVLELSLVHVTSYFVWSGVLLT